MLCTSHSVYTFLSIAISIPWAYGYIEVLNSYNVRVAGFTSHEVVESATLVETVSGIIVSADPPDACERIRDAQQFNTSSAFSKFVLITYLSSSNCSVSEKIQNAANAHFDLAVMYGESFFMPGTDFIKKMLGDTGDIPAVVVAYSDGETIRDKYLYNNKTLEYYLTVIPKNDMRYYFFLFGVVIGVCFLVIIFFMVCLLVKYIQERRRSRRNRLSSRQIKQLPTEKYTKGSQFDVCAICLEDYVEGDKLRILPCSHVYHAKCIDPWLMENRRNCPLCKRRVRLGDSSSESDSDSDGASPTESTPLVTPTSGDNTWGTFTGPSTSGEQLGQSSSRRSEGSTMSHALIVNEDTDSSESENVAALPPGAGSVNALYEDDVLDFRPKSV